MGSPRKPAPSTPISSNTLEPPVPRVHIVSGPSCSGKSTLIHKLERGGAEVIVGVESAALRLNEHSDAIVHYNILFPFEQHYVLGRGWSIRKRLRLFRLLRDRKRWGVYEAGWRTVAIRNARRVRATVLVAARAELLQRIAERGVIGPLNDPPKVPSDLWRAIYDTVDLHEVYRLWLAFLRKRGIAFEVLWSTAGEYTPLPAERIPEVLNGAASAPRG